MMSTSVGPATMSIPTWPTTWRLASATQRLPGPTILSTRGTVAVPNASAPTACAPPIRKIRVTPDRAQAASTVSVTPLGGTTATISCTPATSAGTAFMTTDDGYEAFPPGTYNPTRSSGRHLHADHAAVRSAQVKAGLALVLVVLPDPVHRRPQRLAQRGRDPAQGALPLGGIQLPGRGLEVHPVEPAAELADRLVPPVEHGLEDLGHDLPGLRVGAGTARQQWVERLEGGNADSANHPDLCR